MEIRRLRVRNIRSYEAAELTFPSGTTFLSGDVGAGKTSLLQAIEMALFGFAEVEPEHLVRHQAPRAEVALSFEGDGHTYEIVRRFKRVARRGRTTFELERSTFSADGATAQYSQTELRQRVIELLGFPDNPNPRVPSNLWRWAVYVPQERMREVLGQDPEQRRETIRRALGLDRYRTAADNTQLLATELRHRCALLTRSAEALGTPGQRIQELDQAIPTLEREATERSERLTEAERSVHELSEASKLRQEALGRFAADRRECDQLRQTVERTRLDLARLEEQLHHSSDQRSALESRLEALRGEREIHRGAGEEHRRLEEELRTARGRQEAIQASVVALASSRSQAKEVAAQIQRSERVLASERERRDQILTRLAEMDGPGALTEPQPPGSMSIEEIDRHLAVARATERPSRDREVRARQLLRELDELVGGGTCPRCGQPVRPEEFAPHRASAAEAWARAEAEARTAQEEVGRLEAARAARARYEQQRERYQTWAAQREATRNELRESTARAEGLEGELAPLRHRAAEIQLRLDELAPIEREAETVREQVRGIETRRDALQKALEAVQKIDRELTRLAEAIAGRESEARIWREEAGARQIALAEDARRLAALETTLTEEPAARQALEAIDRELEETRRRVGQLREERATQKSRLEQAVDERERAVRTARQQQELQAAAGRRKRTAEWVGGPLRDALLEMEATLLRQSEIEFQYHFGRYFSALVEDPAIVARVDAGFTPHVLLNGVWTPPEALSGGERTSLALAFRLALGAVVRSLRTLRLGCLILDEPTDGFSEAQVQRMTDLLDQLEIPQIILVSHEEGLARTARRVFYVRKRQGISRVESDHPSGSPGTTAEMPRAAGLD
ncbi:MAG: AAA family ATPase [Thermoplasmata archaeon]